MNKIMRRLLRYFKKMSVENPGFGYSPSVLKRGVHGSPHRIIAIVLWTRVHLDTLSRDVVAPENQEGRMEELISCQLDNQTRNRKMINT